MTVAFLAPLKPPDHPEPSGDRTMARLLIAALERSGRTVEQGPRLRMLDRTGAATPRLAAEARAQAEAAIAAWRARSAAERPTAVFAYHVFYKAPDVAGPLIAAALRIPYVIAEGSRAPKRAGGPWDVGHRLAEAAIDAADLVLVLNERDRPMLERARPRHQRIESLPPFIDGRAWPRPPRKASGASRPVRLLAVAMMRPGDKLASYRLLSDALARVAAPDWTLDIVGDGAMRGEIEALFAPFGPHVTLHGRLEDPSALATLYAGADLLVWPAVNEAFGMVFLEAALQGCPALAGAYGGVPGVIRHGETGVLVEPGSVAAFADALAGMIADRVRLARLSAGATALARERSLEAAAARLGVLLDQLEAERSAA